MKSIILLPPLSFEPAAFKDLAWTGTFDSKAWRDLPGDIRNRIRDRVLAEKDPYASLTDPTGNYTVNANNISPKGHPCN